MLFATGVEETVALAVKKALEEATREGKGWEAEILIGVLAGAICLTAFIVRWLIKSMDSRMQEATTREERMSKRIDCLEDFQRETLSELMQQATKAQLASSEAIRELKESLHAKPCLIDPIRQNGLIDRLADRITERQVDHQRLESEK